jgi:branched-chain amino acid transport system ATP-binding protein
MIDIGHRVDGVADGAARLSSMSSTRAIDAPRSLELRGIVGGYGSLRILNGVDLVAPAASITTLVGPNGAGKSTVLKAIFGQATVTAGNVVIGGRDVTGLGPRALLASGVAFVPQGRNVFPTLSVRANLRLGATMLPRHEIESRMNEVLVRFPRVAERIGSQASALSGGEQKQLEIARALMLRPTVLLIDEPSIGLSPLIVRQVFAMLRELASKGLTVLMVEQNVKRALSISDQGVVLETGRVALAGDALALLADPRMGRIFVGASAVNQPTPSTRNTNG